MHDGIMHMTLSIETTFKACLSLIEDVNRGIKKMSNVKAADPTLMTIDLLKWTRPQTSQWTTTIMDQGIKQGFPKDLLMIWIKPMHKGEHKNLVSNYQTSMVS